MVQISQVGPWISSRYWQIIVDSAMTRPSSSSSAGTVPCGFFWTNSGLRFSPVITLTTCSLTLSSPIPHSAM